MMDERRKTAQDAQKSRLKQQRKTTHSRRLSANQKERRRTQNINTAFAELRRCIPNVPQDTKLSKIRTLRLATSYIGYLQEVLQAEQCRDVGNTQSSKNGRPVHPTRNYKAAIFAVKEDNKTENIRRDLGSWPHYYTWNYGVSDTSPSLR